MERRTDGPLRVGSITVATRSGLLAPGIYRQWSDTLSEVRADDAFAAFESVRAHNAPGASVGLPPRVKLGAILSAWHFDPIDDHPRDPEFAWASVLVNDFREINDDLDMLDGVSGNHLSTLLEWQPRVDHAATAVLAWVRPGPLGAVTYRDLDSAPRLSILLQSHGYDGIILSGLDESPAETEVLVGFANGLRLGGGVPLMLARATESPLQEPFSMTLRAL